MTQQTQPATLTINWEFAERLLCNLQANTPTRLELRQRMGEAERAEVESRVSYVDPELAVDHLAHLLFELVKPEDSPQTVKDEARWNGRWKAAEQLSALAREASKFFHGANSPMVELSFDGVTSAEKAQLIADMYHGRVSQQDTAAEAPSEASAKILQDEVIIKLTDATDEHVEHSLVKAIGEQTLQMIFEMKRAAESGRAGWEQPEWFQNGELTQRLLKHVLAGDQRSLTQAAVLLTFLRCHKANHDERLTDSLGIPEHRVTQRHHP